MPAKGLSEAIGINEKNGRNRPITKPNYWVKIKTTNSSIVVIEVSETTAVH